MTNQSQLGPDAFQMGCICSSYIRFGGCSYATQCH